MFVIPRSALPMFLSLVLVACATSQQSSNGVINNDVAIIKGRAENIFKEILVPIGTKVNINFRKIDGKDMFNAWSGAPTQIELKPGPHTLEVACSGRHDTIEFFGVSLVNLDVKGGEVYQFQPKFDTPRTCSVQLVRMDSSTTVVGEAATPVKITGDQSRIFFIRTNKSSMFFGRSARIQVDGATMGNVWKGRYKIVSIPPGRHRINVDLWDMPGKCELQLTAQAGNEYYFEVFPHSDIASFVAAGANASVIEGDVNKCGGAFALQLLGEAPAKNMITTLRPEN